MDYREFARMMEKKVQYRLGEDVKVERTEKLKNNGVRKEGLTLSHDITPVSPVVYLQDMYEAYQAGMDAEECAMHAAGVLWDGICAKEAAKQFIEDIKSWEASRRRLCPLLLNRKTNGELLEDIVYRPFLDLAICYSLCLSSGAEGTASIRVTRGMLKVWEVSEEELYEQALRNMGNDGYHLERIEKILEELGIPVGEAGKDMPFLFTILTNRRKLFGAAGVLKPELLEEFATETGGNLFVIPSSIHEMLLLPDKGQMSIQELNEMIRDVNETQIRPEEWLSDHPYYYDRELHEVRIAA